MREEYYLNVKTSESWLEETVEALGHQLSFFSKFERELNFIEMLYVKAELLRRMCTFNFSDLNEEAVTRASRHCLRYMDDYRIGGPELFGNLKVIE